MNPTILKAERRNLDYPQVQNTLVEQLEDYADNS
jgi:hypothetical protein